jgi:uncharacterized RDD family membrane protein YckC
VSASLGKRIRAGVIDLGLALAWAGVVVGAGYGLRSAGLLSLGPLALNLLGGTLIVLPIVAFFALAEGGRYEASPGKQWSGLRVRRLDGRPLGRPRALLRNLVKLALPAVLAHAATLMLLTGQTGADVVLLAAIALSLPLSYLLLICFGERRGPWDLLCGAEVASVSAGRRFA